MKRVHAEVYPLFIPNRSLENLTFILSENLMLIYIKFSGYSLFLIINKGKS